MSSITTSNIDIGLAKNFDNNQEKYLIFELNHIVYGIAIVNIMEIIEYQTPSKVPNLPDFLHGLLNLRGKLLPVIDLNAYLENIHGTVNKKTCIIIVNYFANDQAHLAGIMVDQVLEVVTVNPGSLEKPPDFAVNLDPKVVAGILILDEKIITLLDINNMFFKPITVQT